MSGRYVRPTPKPRALGLAARMKRQAALAAAITEVEAAGQLVPCRTQTPDRRLWVSDDRDDQTRAAALCNEGPCPVLALCLNAGVGEAPRAAVWGGRVQYARRNKEESC